MSFIVSIEDDNGNAQWVSQQMFDDPADGASEATKAMDLQRGWSIVLTVPAWEKE